MEKTFIGTIRTRKLTLSAMLLAIGLILPSFTGPQLGSVLLPMHIPALLAGIIVGKKQGMMVGILIPLFRSFLFGMPPIIPIASAMAIEMGVYAFVAGLVIGRRKFSMKKLYTAIVTAMLAGRIAFGLVMFVMLSGLGLGAGVYSISIWFTSVFTSSLVGIGFHLIMVPAIAATLWKSGIIREE